MTPNPKIRELIMSMGIIPESEHYDIAERVIRQCVEICNDTNDASYLNGVIAGKKIKQHFGVEE